jgi:amidohydrolase
VIFGLHVTSAAHAGRVSYRAGAAMAGADGFRIAIKGRQTHAASPWRGVDPIVVGAQVVLALQTIASRQVDVTREPAVLTVGIFNAGNRGNIIPDSAELVGTLRTFDPETRQFIMRRVKETAEGIARSAGAEADVHWRPTSYLPVINDPALARRMAPTFQRVVPADQLSEARRITAAEDFSLYAREIPGLYFFLGAVAPGTPIEEAAPNHSPRFTLDESALLTGLRALTHLTVDYMTGGGGS